MKYIGSPESYLLVSGLMFTIGLLGVLIKRNAIIIFMCVEIMLNAANLALVTAARAHNSLDGHILAFFVMTVAACEAAVGLSLIVLYYNLRRNVDADEINVLKG